MHIETYSGKYDKEIVLLILDIQNNEAKIGLTLIEQPDLLDIEASYRQNAGEFWLALSDGNVIGTLGLMMKERNCAVMKKFFVKKSSVRRKSDLHCIINCLNLQRTPASDISCWILRWLHTHHTDFMKKQASGKSARTNCPCRTHILTGTVFSICWICKNILKSLGIMTK